MLKNKFLNHILDKRYKYDEKLDSISYRLLAQIKFLFVLIGTVLLLNLFFYPRNILFSPTAITILCIMIFINILYSFDYLFIILYILVKRIIKPISKSKDSTNKTKGLFDDMLEEPESPTIDVDDTSD